MNMSAKVVLRQTIIFSKGLVDSFAGLSGDRNPIHLDEQYSKSTRFGRPIAHGVIAGCFAEALLAKQYPHS